MSYSCSLLPQLRNRHNPMTQSHEESFCKNEINIFRKYFFSLCVFVVVGFLFIFAPTSFVVGRPDESGQGGGQRGGHVGAEGQERCPGGRGRRAPEPGHRRRHPVRPVHLPAGGVRQGTRKQVGLVENKRTGFIYRYRYD